MEHRITNGTQRLDITVKVCGLALVNPLFNTAGARQSIGIPEGQQRAIEQGPAVQEIRNTPQVYDRPKMGLEEGELSRFQGAVLKQHLNRYIDRHYIPHLAVVFVLIGVVGVEF